MASEFYLHGLEYLEQFQRPIDPWMKEIREEGIRTKVPIIDDDMGRFLGMICSLLKPSAILEIGCGISYATHWMLMGSPETQITGLDNNRDRLDRCEIYLQKSGNLNRVALHRIWAEDFFQSNKQRFDLIFQDSTKKEYAGMIENCYQSLNPDGLLIADNIFYNKKVFGLASDQTGKYQKAVMALEEFNRQMVNHKGFECHFLAISDGVLIAKRK
jgi:predicted O-methyltransferase YrrM